jgi:hypothetical protein
MKKSKLTDDLILDLYKNYYLKGLNPREIEKLDVCPCSDTTLERHFLRLSLPTRDNSVAQRKYAVNEDYFENIDTPEKAWILGFIGADGSNNPSTNSLVFHLAIKDEEILTQIKEELSSEHNLFYLVKKDTGRKYVILSIASRKMSKDLIRQGIIPNKTLQYSFPTQLPKNLYRHFLRGYFDGDGCIYYTQKRKRLGFSIVGTADLCNFLSDILREELDVHGGVRLNHAKSANQITSVIDVAGNKQITKVMNWMYEDATISLKRKVKKYFTSLEHLNTDRPIPLEYPSLSGYLPR